MWEGQKVIESETYGNADHRIEYKADGSYDYYNKSGDDRVLNALQSHPEFLQNPQAADVEVDFGVGADIGEKHVCNPGAKEK